VLTPEPPFSFTSDQCLAVFHHRYPVLVELSAELSLPEPAVPAESLAECCARGGLHTTQVLGSFAIAAIEQAADGDADWTDATLDELIHNILTVHHVFVRAQLGRLGALLDAIVQARGTGTHRLDRLQAGLTFFRQRWLGHLEMEEKQFFSACMKLENTRGIMPRNELDDLLGQLRHVSHDHREIDRLEESIVQSLESALCDIPDSHRVHADAMAAAIEVFHNDAAIHAFKEDEILLPAVLFTHEIRRSDTESGRYSSYDG
jgi:iron-sulfur cluster repair protein YtfE (RIC family)